MVTELIEKMKKSAPDSFADKGEHSIMNKVLRKLYLSLL